MIFLPLPDGRGGRTPFRAMTDLHSDSRIILLPRTIQCMAGLVSAEAARKKKMVADSSHGNLLG